MTIEEAIERYSHNAEYERADGNLQGCLEFNQLADWLKDYKRLLEQEPCGDCVNRQAILNLKQTFHDNAGYETEFVDIEDIKNMPSVKQEPKVGHWIKGKCDRCGGHAPFWSMSAAYYESEYCPKCGARMEAPNGK